MPKTLTDTQRVILANAAARDTRRVLPTPKTLNKNAGAIALSMRALISSGWVKEVAAHPGDLKWGTLESGEPTTLVITELTFAALGINEGATEELPSAAVAGGAESPAPMPKPGSKLAILIGRLSQPGGATIDQLARATGWQKHSVRGALSGALRSRNLTVTSELMADRGRVYSLAAAADGREEDELALVSGD